MIAVVAGAAVLMAVCLAGGERARRDERLRLVVSASPAAGSASSRGAVPVIVAAACAGVVSLLGPAVAAIGASVCVALVVSARRVLRRRRAATCATEIVDVLFAMAAELRCGQPPGRAIEVAAGAAPALASQLRRAASVVAAGGSAAAELAEMGARPGCDGLRAAAAAWQVTEARGAATAEVLDRLAGALDAEIDARRTLDAALAGPRATMVMLGALPVAGVLVGQSLGADPLRLLVHSRLGALLLCGAAVLDAVGIAWTLLLVRRATR